MNGPVLAFRAFSLQDQRAFADASGDRNPMHLDRRAAARTQAGAPVVHGAHALLWALDALVAKDLEGKPIRAVHAQFNRFVYLDRPLELRVTERSQDGMSANMSVAGLRATSLTLQLGPAAAAGENPFRDATETILGELPLEPVEAEMDGARGWLAPLSGAAALAKHFPALAAALGPRRVAAIAQMSALVGMACPGLNSIFSSLSFEVLDDDVGRPGIGWAAKRASPRYSRIDLNAQGSGLRLEAHALIRPSAVAPPSMTQAQAAVTTGEFAGRRALIIGGSRGLGAAAAKLLAAGGASVAITYASDDAEAESVAADIRAAQGAVTSVFRCDVLQPFDAALETAMAEATHLYYFATPRIARQGAATFDAEAWREFARVYVERFNDLCVRAAALSKPPRLSVLYPSTTAVAERPKGMTEYAMAKAAGELLCADLARSHSRLSITAPRLPRVLTDQTALAIPVKAASAVEAMLPLLRAEVGV
jgi:NAD(P)-dependent dehydrogenase (short-subunit alcohol dehydrogenase family)